MDQVKVKLNARRFEGQILVQTARPNAWKTEENGKLDRAMSLPRTKAAHITWPVAFPGKKARQSRAKRVDALFGTPP